MPNTDRRVVRGLPQPANGGRVDRWAFACRAPAMPLLVRLASQYAVVVSRLRSRVSIASTSPAVWDRLMDWEQMGSWFLGVKRVKLLSAEPAVGAVRLLQLSYGPTHRERITRWHPPTGFSIEVVDPPFIGRDWAADIDLHEHAAGVDVSWELRYEPRFGAVGRVINSLLILPFIGIAFRWSLRNLRVAIEAGGPRGSSRRGRPESMRHGRQTRAG